MTPVIVFQLLRAENEESASLFYLLFTLFDPPFALLGVLLQLQIAAVEGRAREAFGDAPLTEGDFWQLKDVQTALSIYTLYSAAALVGGLLWMAYYIFSFPLSPTRERRGRKEREGEREEGREERRGRGGEEAAVVANDLTKVITVGIKRGIALLPSLSFSNRVLFF